MLSHGCRYSFRPSAENEAFDNIIIITDRDELDTEDNFIRQIERVMGNYNVQAVNGMENDVWAECTYINGQGKKKEVKLLLLVIPFEQTGAMETFLLNAVSENDEYDAGLMKSAIILLIWLMRKTVSDKEKICYKG